MIRGGGTLKTYKSVLGGGGRKSIKFSVRTLRMASFVFLYVVLSHLLMDYTTDYATDLSGISLCEEHL